MDSDGLLSQSCRICSTELEHGILVFSEEGKSLFLQAKIRKYLYITVSLEDKLPKMICDSCCKKLEGIHKFATMAVKIQDKFNKLVTDSINNINNNEPKHSENKGLLHTYLTKGIKEKEEITEMEVKVDPMLILECAFDDDDISEDAVSDTENENLTSNEKLADIENNYEEATENVHKPFSYRISEFALQNHMWNHLPQNKHVLLFNFNNSNNCKWEENSEDKQCENRSSSSTASEAETSENLTTENSEGNLRFTCPICGKIISTKGNLKVHLETHRPKGKYGCDICGRIFKTQCNLYRHKEYHEGVQFPCAVCGRVYPTNSTLRAHSITHSDLRPHKCPLCVKTFKRNQDLKFHINQHTGARPYQCPYCPKAFASSGNCFSHRKRMHPLEVERDREKAAKIMR